MKQTFLNILFLLNIGRPGLSQPQITTFFSTGNNWTDVVQLNPETYVATSGMQLIRTENAGQTWSIVYTFPANQGADMLFEHNDTLYACGNRIYRSINGGIAWQFLSDPPGNGRIQKMLFYPGGKIRVVTQYSQNENAGLWETNNGFSTYSNILSYNGGLYDVVGFGLYVTSVSQGGIFDIKKTFSGGAAWQNANISLAPYSAGFTNYTNKLHCSHPDSCFLFINYYMNHVFFTNDGFASVQFDTLLMASQIMEYFSCGSRDYILHTAVDGSSGYIFSVEKLPSGKLKFLEKTLLGLYVSGFHYKNQQLVAVGADFKGLRVTGLCATTSSRPSVFGKAKYHIQNNGSAYRFCSDDGTILKEARLVNSRAQVVQIFGQNLGSACISWDSRNLPPGVYVLRFRDENGNIGTRTFSHSN
jgi:hypothetical protein